MNTRPALLDIRDKGLDLSKVLFSSEGRSVTVLERDGKLVRYFPLGTRKEELGEVGQDLFMIGQLKTLEAQIAALQSSSALQGGGSKDVPLGLKTAGPGLICVFNGALCYRFFKQGGYRANFASVSMGEAKGLVSGTHQLKYVSGTSRFRILPK